MSNQTKPSVRAARFPADYSQSPDPGVRMEWSFIEEQLREAKNYWLASEGSTGAPHVRPVDGVWVDGALCFGGSDETRWARNMQERPRISVNLPGDDLAVILEGTVELVTDAANPLSGAQAAASRAKYPQYYKDIEIDMDGASEAFSPFWMLRPNVVYAWTLTGFPNKATRWSFDLP